MSDQPLFREADEQEAKFAPQQLPRDDDDARGAIAPTTAGAFLPADAAPGPATTPTAPVVGAAALAQETQRQHSDDHVS